MASWNAIFVDLESDPVHGDLASFDTAASEARRLHTSSGFVADEFAGVTTSGELSELRGDTADRLVHLIGTMDGSLADLPSVFDELDRIFTQHADQLGALRQRTVEGLARADLRWSAVHDARADHAEAVATLGSIRSQLSHLRSRGDDLETLDRVDTLELDLWRQQDVVAARELSASDAAVDLELSRTEYHRFEDEELSLVNHTVESIGRIALDDLQDPGRLEQLVSDVVGGLVWYGREAIEAIIDAAVGLVRDLALLAEFTLTESLRALALAVKSVLVSHLAAASVVLLLLSKRFPPRPTSGDLASGYQSRTSPDPARATYHVAGADDAERGLNAMLTALGHTGDEAQIFTDEFEIIKITDNRFIVVLPGVTDLSRPNYGLNPHTRTVRDVDQFALPSNASVGIAGNRYAEMAMEAMRANGVPTGAHVMLVGHSYGGDTALDLAADPQFNGPGAFDVTHAVAAGYDSRPQLSHVPSTTEVLVLQNNRDAAVLAEHAGTPITEGVDRFMGGLDRIIARDPLGGIGDLVTAGGTIAHAHAPADQLVPRVETSLGHTQIVFAGGGAGAGHHQSNYLDYLSTTREPAVRDFAASVGAAGYGEAGSISAIDVSVPTS